MRKVRQSSALAVPGDEVPTPAGVDERVRLHLSPRVCAFARGVVEAHPLAVATGLGDDGQGLGVDGGAVAAGSRRRRRCTALTRRRRRSGSTCSSLTSARTDVSLDARPSTARGGAQPDGDGDRLVVVE